MKPRIGIIPAVDNDRTAFVQQYYIAAIAEAGGAPLILPYTDEPESIEFSVGTCDGFMFIGGADIDPARYGAQRLPQCGELVPPRDEYEFALFNKIFDTGKPILAICRGMQLANVALGGSLYQDLSTEHPSEIVHRDREIKYTNTHRVLLCKEGPLSKICGTCEMTINSYHHQAIKEMGKGLSVAARAVDGIIEGVYCEGERYLIGVQWHPERMADGNNRAIFTDLVRHSEFYRDQHKEK